MNRGHKQTDLIVMDFAKAFDKVPHRRLLHKLDYYGVRGSILKWINSWLSGHTQQVVLDGQASDPVPVLAGVPSDFIWDFGKLPFPTHLGKYFIKIGKIRAKIHEIGKIKAIFGLGMTPIYGLKNGQIKSLVPQGSVIGPILFLIFINELPDNFRSSVRLFAADCVLYRNIIYILFRSV